MNPDTPAASQPDGAVPAPAAPVASPAAAPSGDVPQMPAGSAPVAPASQVPADTLSRVQGADVVAPAAASPDAATTAAQAMPPGVPEAAVQGAPVEHIAQAADHSLLGLVLQAGPVVQGVMGALVLASVVCWTIMIEKAILLGGLKREIQRLRRTGEGDAPNGEGLAARIQRAAAREWAEGRDAGESRAEYRERIERAMRETLTGGLRRAQTGTAFLATTGAVGPFVGLFGTVWGIMGSFQGIAQMRDTSLAVVAPGIAEALLATAIGLVAAIPAVIGYNRIARRIAGLRAEGLEAISALGARLSARPPRGGLARAAE